MSKLILIGAGPGDPDYITLKAIKALKNADVVLYDALVNKDILSYVNKLCILIFAGKRYGCHYLSQTEINDLIIEYGGKYENIVRLKGGDPFVFGRAQEEMDAAHGAGMEVEVIPGISSCIAAPASQMIPLTCRGVNESFWVTTGTTSKGTISDDIYLAAKSSATIIILMAMSKLEEITAIFIKEGKTETPVAIIENATTANEKFVLGKIKDITYKALFANIQNPAVIVIGEVVNLHQRMINQHIERQIINEVEHNG